MIHRLHNAAHLPSVLGVATDSTGARIYNAPPQPLEIVGFGDRLFDFSEFSFPVMPSAYVAFLYDTAGTTYTGAAGNGPMPRDVATNFLDRASVSWRTRFGPGWWRARSATVTRMAADRSPLPTPGTATSPR
jgi:hypothetical protein